MQTHQNLFHTTSFVDVYKEETPNQLRWGLFTSRFTKELYKGVKLRVIKPDTNTKNNEFGIKYDSVDGSLKGLNDETLYAVVVNKDGKPIDIYGRVTENPEEMLYNSLLDSEPIMKNIDNVPLEERERYKKFRLKLHEEFNQTTYPIYLEINGTTNGQQSWDKKDGDINQNIIGRIWESIPKKVNDIITVITNKIDDCIVGSVTITTQFDNEVHGTLRKILNEEADNIIAMLRVVAKNFIKDGSYYNAFQFKDNGIEFDIERQIASKIYFGLFTNRKLRNLPISKAIGFNGNYLYYGVPNNNSRLNSNKNIESQLNKININDLANIEQHPELKEFLMKLYHNVSKSHLNESGSFMEYIVDNATMKVKKTNAFRKGYGEYLLSGDNPALGTNARSMFVTEAKTYQDLPFKNRHLTFSDKYIVKEVLNNEFLTKNNRKYILNKLLEFIKNREYDINEIMDKAFSILDRNKFIQFHESITKWDLSFIELELDSYNSEDKKANFLNEHLLTEFIYKELEEINKKFIASKQKILNNTISSKTIQTTGEYEVKFSINGCSPRSQIVEYVEDDGELYFTVKSFRHVGKFKQEFEDSLLTGEKQSNLNIISVKPLNIIQTPGEYEVIFSINGGSPITQIVEYIEDDGELFLTLESFRRAGKFEQEFEDSLLKGVIGDNIKIISVKPLSPSNEIIPESNQPLEELLDETTKINKVKKIFDDLDDELNGVTTTNNDFGRPGDDAEEISKFKKN